MYLGRKRRVVMESGTRTPTTIKPQIVDFVHSEGENAHSEQNKRGKAMSHHVRLSFGDSVLKHRRPI